MGNPKKVIFQQYYLYILQIIYVISEENKLLPPYRPHVKNVTALPCKMKKLYLTEGNVAFLQMLVTLKRAGCGLALLTLKMTNLRYKKITIEYDYADNRKQ